MRITVIIIILMIAACSPNPRIVNSSAERDEEIARSTNVQPAVSTFEADLEAMRIANYPFIYVLRRKDGGVLDADDRKLLGQNIPSEVDRRKLTDGDRAVMVGSKHRIPDDRLKLLRDRFDFQDLSASQSGIMNSNSNTR